MVAGYQKSRILNHAMHQLTNFKTSAEVQCNILCLYSLVNTPIASNNQSNQLYELLIILAESKWAFSLLLNKFNAVICYN